MIAYIVKLNENIYHLKCKFHKNIIDMFTLNNITYDCNNQVYVIPARSRNDIINQLLNMKVSVKEILSFDPTFDRPKELIYNINDDVCCIFFMYDQKVIVIH